MPNTETVSGSSYHDEAQHTPLFSIPSEIQHQRPWTRHLYLPNVELSKRNIDTNLIDFDDLPSLFTLGWTQAQIEAAFNDELNRAAALTSVAVTALQQLNVATTPEYVQWFGTAAMAPILGE